MKWTSPFTLTEREISDINKFIDYYSEVLDTAKEIVKDENKSAAALLSFLCGKKVDGGACRLSSHLSVWIPFKVEQYFKYRVVPYSAYWGKTPEQIYHEQKELYIHPSDVKTYMYLAVEIRFNNFNEALVLAEK